MISSSFSLEALGMFCDKEKKGRRAIKINLINEEK